MKTFKDRVAVITGAASGIGLAMAERFADEGMKIVLADIEEEALAKATESIQAKGVQALAVKTDVSKLDEVEALKQKAYEEFGAVHMLCNNAGVASSGAVWELEISEWEWVLGVNLWGVIYGLRTFVPAMIAQDEEGHVVNTASLAGIFSGPSMAPYSVSKFGVVTISESMYYELHLLGHKIKVSVLCPGWVNTGIGESDRNHPGRGRRVEDDRPQIGGLNHERVRKFLKEGLDPAQVAEAVFDAVKNEKLYIFTHEGFKERIEIRLTDMLESRNPVYQPPPFE